MPVEVINLDLVSLRALSTDKTNSQNLFFFPKIIVCRPQNHKFAAKKVPQILFRAYANIPAFRRTRRLVGRLMAEEEVPVVATMGIIDEDDAKDDTKMDPSRTSDK